jgi:hypothetical protein
MLAMTLAYTVVIGIVAPRHWLEPFGGLLKNICIVATLMVLLAVDTGRR